MQRGCTEAYVVAERQRSAERRTRVVDAEVVASALTPHAPAWIVADTGRERGDRTILASHLGQLGFHGKTRIRLIVQTSEREMIHGTRRCVVASRSIQVAER